MWQQIPLWRAYLNFDKTKSTWKSAADSIIKELFDRSCIHMNNHGCSRFWVQWRRLSRFVAFEEEQVDEDGSRQEDNFSARRQWHRTCIKFNEYFERLKTFGGCISCKYKCLTAYAVRIAVCNKFLQQVSLLLRGYANQSARRRVWRYLQVYTHRCRLYCGAVVRNTRKHGYLEFDVPHALAVVAGDRRKPTDVAVDDRDAGVEAGATAEVKQKHSWNVQVAHVRVHVHVGAEIMKILQLEGLLYF